LTLIVESGMETVKLEWPKPGYARITLARPSHHNALRNEELQAIDEATQRVADSDCRVLTIIAEGASFCVGGDVIAFGKALDNNPAAFIREGGRFVISTISRLRTMDAAVVVGAQGIVAGGGTGFLLAGDMVIAADDLKINLAYIRIGATPDAGVSWFLPRLVGLPKAFELLAFAENVDAEQAIRIGLINRVVAAAGLRTTIEETVDRLLSISPTSLRTIKRLLRSSDSNTLETQLHCEFEAFASAGRSAEFKEGVRRFLARHSDV
jgi:2-(1,2-epoxy-1,2-dihydrophenyl)acetyl-CoA isomerase